MSISQTSDPIKQPILGTDYGQIKLVYTSIMGTALLIFTITGFWLWYGPKRYRAHSKYHRLDR